MYGYIEFACTLGYVKLLIKTCYFDEIAILTEKERPVCLPGNAHLSM